MSDKKHLLLADDSATARSFLKDMLSKEGYEVWEAPNGREALRIIDETAIDAMILDLLMPEMDGFEVLEKLKEKGQHLPVVVLTADIQEQVKNECLDLGASAILNKPFSDEDLRETLKTVTS